ncbi:hypothetical protein L916_01217 [Phytophthora nicotianae]|uniref:Uncharacterized protein n=1 Tax=Phytophthora nicotianae TaxID=4792 RepID=W2JUF6_PHYNI|nr:hypothetical protein L916_01217 [Phytophthora nicotianae]
MKSGQVTNWTVKQPGKVTPPTCNDYESWTFVQLRKECTQRKLRLVRTTSKQDQICRLRAYDAAKRAVQGTVDEEIRFDPSLRKTKHCFVRLLNIIFSDHFAEGLARSDDTVTRDQLDAGKVNAKTVFWKDLGSSFVRTRQTTTTYSKKLMKARALRALTPVIVPHNDARLYDMWKFVKANAKFYVSGQNSNESYDFCDDNLDTVYLKICTRIKPKLTDFVNGGMYPEDEIDSLEISASRKAAPTNKPAKWQDQVLKTTNRMANLKVGPPTSAAASSASVTQTENKDEDQLIDRIAKFHQLIDQVKQNQRKAELAGENDISLAASLLKYFAALRGSAGCYGLTFFAKFTNLCIVLSRTPINVVVLRVNFDTNLSY